MKKSKKLLSILLACLMIISMFPAAAFANEDGSNSIGSITIEGKDGSYDTLSAAVNAATAGDTINLPTGIYEIGSLNINKPINLAGEGTVTLKGSVMYSNFPTENTQAETQPTLSVSNITFAATDNNSHQGLCFSTGVTNYTLNVTNCTFAGWEYAIGVNSNASNNTLNVSGTIFTDNGCAVSVKGGSTGNKIGSYTDNIQNSGFAAQIFNPAETSGYQVNGYYNDMATVLAQQESGSYTPDVDVLTDNTKKVVFNANDLEKDINTADTTATTIYIGKDIELTKSIYLTINQNITINGNGHTISYDGVSTKTAFKITGTANEMVGTPTGVTLNVNDVTFKNTNANSTRSGYAVLIGGNSNNTSVNLDQCSFNNLYCAVLGNAFTDTTKADEAPDFSITNSTFTDTQFGYSVDAVTPGAIVGAGNITFTDNKGEVAEQETFTKTEAYVTRNSVTTVASSFTDAITNAQFGDVITLAKNLESETVITLPAGVTLDGNGYMLSYNNTESTPTNGAFITATGNNVVIKNITLDLDGIKHGVQFYCTNGGKIENATINGANWTAVQVNGAQNIELINTTLNPNDGTNAYANIEFSMGKNVTTIPSLTIDGVSFDSQYPAIWVDDDTVAAIKGQLGAGANNDAVSDKITSNITNNNKSDITIVVEFVPGKSENVIAESTYEPPYTGKFSHEIFTTVGDNGAIDVDRYATEGDKVTITVSPDEAYMLDKMTVTSGGKDVEVTDNGDGTYTFTMPSGDVKIEVTFAEDPNWEPEPEEPAMPFVDVNENDWFYDVVLYAYENGLMTGTSADTFAPNTATTRGMIVSMLARLEGVTSAESAGFTDVADNDWYATAVNWAASEGIVNGFEDDTFRPNDAITREQMAAILYNYADYKGYDVSARADLSDYADAADVSSWAEDVLAWANAEGLINGMTATTIDPQGATTRAQTAAMFERFLTAHAE